MSYRDSDETEGTTTRWYWPDLGTLEESYAVARKAFGGWFFAGMILVGGLITYFSGKSVTDLKTPESNLPAAVAGIAVELLFVLFASYRMVTGRGWIVSWLLLAVFAAEILFKILSGTAGIVGWLIFYVAVGASLLTGARACWKIHSLLKAGETIEN